MEPMEGNVQEIFYKVAGQDMELDSEELQQVLNTSLKKGSLKIFTFFKLLLILIF